MWVKWITFCRKIEKEVAGFIWGWEGGKTAHYQMQIYPMYQCLLAVTTAMFIYAPNPLISSWPRVPAKPPLPSAPAISASRAATPLNVFHAFCSICSHEGADGTHGVCEHQVVSWLLRSEQLTEWSERSLTIATTIIATLSAPSVLLQNFGGVRLRPCVDPTQYCRWCRIGHTYRRKYEKGFSRLIVQFSLSRPRLCHFFSFFVVVMY